VLISSTRTSLEKKPGSVALLILALAALAVIAMIAFAGVWFTFMRELP